VTPTGLAGEFAVLAPVTLPAGLALAGLIWAWRNYAVTAGLAGIRASASITFDARQWGRQVRTAQGLTHASGAVPLLARGGRIPVGGTIRAIGHPWHPVFALNPAACARFAELHAEREQLQARLDALAAVVPQAADTSLLDELPLAGDILPGLPPDLKARLFDAFDLHILWNKAAGQATIWAEITDATLRALQAILNPGQDGYDDTSEHASDQPELMEDLFEPAITATM
jgi:hypothetical protein